MDDDELADSDLDLADFLNIQRHPRRGPGVGGPAWISFGEDGIAHEEPTENNAGSPTESSVAAPVSDMEMDLEQNDGFFYHGSPSSSSSSSPSPSPSPLPDQQHHLLQPTAAGDSGNGHERQQLIPPRSR
ncbi:hypothetical protein HJFPF1_00369 [Paramyrothecium foliicola]|nr:hypothetical protein HJFPF1_00369 [Paramyrothecium foliicola]